MEGPGVWQTLGGKKEKKRRRKEKRLESGKLGEKKKYIHTHIHIWWYIQAKAKLCFCKNNKRRIISMYDGEEA